MVYILKLNLDNMFFMALIVVSIALFCFGCMRFFKEEKFYVVFS